MRRRRVIIIWPKLTIELYAVIVLSVREGKSNMQSRAMCMYVGESEDEQIAIWLLDITRA